MSYRKQLTEAEIFAVLQAATSGSVKEMYLLAINKMEELRPDLKEGAGIARAGDGSFAFYVGPAFPKAVDECNRYGWLIHEHPDSATNAARLALIAQLPHLSPDEITKLVDAQIYGTSTENPYHE